MLFRRSLSKRWLSPVSAVVVLLLACTADTHGSRDQNLSVFAGEESDLHAPRLNRVLQRLQMLSELQEADIARQDDPLSDGKDEFSATSNDEGDEDADLSKTEDAANTSDDGGQKSPDEGGDDPKDPDTDNENTTSSTSDSDSAADSENVQDEIKGSRDSESREGIVESGASEDENTSANLTDPFDDFMLMQMKELDTEKGFEQVTIYEHGSFVGPFANSPNSSVLKELVGTSDDLWYKDTEYVDRIAFQFTYAADSMNYSMSEPTVQTDSSSGILPSVDYFKNDPSMGDGSFTIMYRCQRNAPQTSRVSMKLQVTAERAIETTWSKKCGSGRHEHLEFGFKSHDHAVTLFNPDGTYGTDEQRILEVGPIELSTELVMKLTPPALNMQFLDPYIFSDSEDVSVQLRGTVSTGTVNGDTPTSFSILYECKAATTAQIAFSVEIPPWDNVTAHWRKDCGGSHSQALIIGTSGAGSYDVMKDGELEYKYNVTDDTTLDEAYGVVEEIPGNTDSRRFYLTNSGDTSDIHIQTITTTMSNPEVLATIVKTPLLGSYLPTAGDIIRRQDTKSLYLHFVCKKEGKSLVLVTLPTLRYTNVEFGFIKDCDEPKVYHHSGFLQTASSLMASLLVVVILAAAGTCIYIRRRRGLKYSTVPTDDPMIP